jgi:hypothetical protein
MKTSPARIASIAVLVGALLLLWACYPAAKVSYSNPQDTVARQWLIEFKPTEAKIQLSMSYRRAGNNNGFSFNNTDFGVTLDQLVGLTREQVMSSSGTNVNFQLKRDAGTFIFEGWFKDGNGSGHFIFSPSSCVSAELSRQGFGRATDEQLQSLAMSDTGLAFINELKESGLRHRDRGTARRMGNHGVRLEYLQGLKSLGYSVKTTDLVVRMKDHGVSLNFIRELAALGYSNLKSGRTGQHKRSRRQCQVHQRVYQRRLQPLFTRRLDHVERSRRQHFVRHRVKRHSVTIVYRWKICDA